MTLHQLGAQLLTSLYLPDCLMWVLVVAAEFQQRGLTLAPANHGSTLCQWLCCSEVHELVSNTTYASGTSHII